jgi:hypothetical protein
VDETIGVVTLTALGAAVVDDDTLADVTYNLGVTANDGTENSAEIPQTSSSKALRRFSLRQWPNLILLMKMVPVSKP